MKTAGSRRYTIEDIRYIEENMDDPEEVAAVLDRSLASIKIYIRKIRRGELDYDLYKIARYYAVYLRKTDELICSGTSEECASYFGIALHSFYTMVSKAKHNKIKKWDIYVEDINVEEEYE